MRTSHFNSWLAQLSQLSPRQREQLPRCLSASAPLARDMPPLAVRELRQWGASGGLPRYRCKCCGKTSNLLTSTPMARL